MNRETWQRAKDILADALEVPPEARRSYVQAVCRDDLPLLRAIENLLAKETEAEVYLENPVFSWDILSHDKEEIDRVIGPFRLIEILGKGGMGTVYLAERVSGGFEQKVAIKLLKRGMDSEEINKRFEEERQILARLDHPYIARLLDGGATQDGRPYLAMDYVKGERMDVYCDRHKASIPERIELFRSVCDAVQYAHRNLVVHRDLKPANILVTSDGVPKLLDFGIAKILERDQALTATASAAPMTPLYASPEQVRGETITTATDVYALGVLLYELLSGTVPYPLDLSLPQLHQAICEKAPTRPSVMVMRTHEKSREEEKSLGLREEPRRVSRHLSGDLDTIVLTALRKEPERRFASVEQLSEDLLRHLEGHPIRSRKDTFGYRTGKFLKRNAWAVVALTSIAILIFGYIILITLQQARIAQERDRAEQERDRAEQERDRAEEVKKYLFDFMRASDPDVAQGREITVREAIDRARKEFADSGPQDPRIRADVADLLGRLYTRFGSYSDARTLLEEALALRRTHLSEGDILIAATLQNLAGVERYLSPPDKVEELLRESIAIQRKVHPQGHFVLAAALNDLASLLLQQNRLQEAEELSREGLRMKYSIGDSDEEIAFSQNTLATVLRERGGFTEAERLYRDALAIRQRDSPMTSLLARVQNNLATLLLDELNRPSEAVPLYFESLEIRRRLWGPADPRIAGPLNNLALAHQVLGELEKAHASIDEAIQLQSQSRDRRPRPMAIFKKNKAMFLSDDGEFPACEQVAIEALDILRESGKPSDIAETESILAGCIAGQGRRGEAHMLVDTFRTLSRLKGSEHRQTRQAISRIERFLGQDLALDLLQEARDGKEPEPPAESSQ